MIILLLLSSLIKYTFYSKILLRHCEWEKNYINNINNQTRNNSHPCLDNVTYLSLVSAQRLKAFVPVFVHEVEFQSMHWLEWPYPFRIKYWCKTHFKTFSFCQSQCHAITPSIQVRRLFWLYHLCSYFTLIIPKFLCFPKCAINFIILQSSETTVKKHAPFAT